MPELRACVAAGPPYSAGLVRELKEDPRQGAQALLETVMGYRRAERRERTRLVRMWTFEREAAEQGFLCVAGVDEAGRGPLAGPIVAGAVVLRTTIRGLNDSKQLLAEQRDSLFHEIVNGGHSYGVGIVCHETIDRLGIQAANYSAMAQAVMALPVCPDFLLVDGFQLPGVSQPVRRVIKGDAKSLSIAAASIIAKVTRDRLMDAYHEQYPEYGFNRHKGYSTPEHYAALERYGPCEIHRRSFAPIARRSETGYLFDSLEDSEEMSACE